MSTNTSKQKGFTIIEVLIVLAIAGLIILIVFIAVPALQRNARNTARKNDIGVLSSQLVQYKNNNGNKYPEDCSGTEPIRCDESYIISKPAYYGIENISFKNWRDSFPGIDTHVYRGSGNTEWVTIANNFKCTTDPIDGEVAKHEGASYQNMVAVYDIETARGTDHKCIDL